MRSFDFSPYVKVLYKVYLKNKNINIFNFDYGEGDYFFNNMDVAISTVSNYETAYITTYNILTKEEVLNQSTKLLYWFLYVAKNRKIFDVRNYPVLNSHFMYFDKLPIKNGLYYDDRYNNILTDYLENRVSDAVVLQVMQKFYSDDVYVFTEDSKYFVLKKESKRIAQAAKTKSNDLNSNTKEDILKIYTKLKNDTCEVDGSLVELLDNCKLKY